MSVEGPGISTTGIDPRRFLLHSHAPNDICGREEQDKENPPAVVARDVVPQDESPQKAEQTLESLIAELVEEDGNEPDPEEVAAVTERPIDPNLLLTDHARGLTDTEVLAARRKYGWNRMKEERQSKWAKFFMMFVGPVQFVMEVSTHPHSANAVACNKD